MYKQQEAQLSLRQLALW